jgi:galactokinase
VPRASRDLERLAELVSDLGRREPRARGLFDSAREVVLTRAPGRLDVLGGFADYSGALVLELPLGEAACVAAAWTEDAEVRIVSVGDPYREARFPAAELWAACRDAATARAFFAARAADWAGYVLGGACFLREPGTRPLGGLSLLLRSDVPEGQGVSSSAAIEVAAARALAELWGVTLSGPELGLLCQRVENHVVGAACGVMDQMTSACGRAGELFALSCQPAELRGSLPLPKHVSLWGVASGVRHAVIGDAYRNVRVAAFMGLRILAEQLGARVHCVGSGLVQLEGDPLRGYLANWPRDQASAALLAKLPERLSGGEFLARYAGISDSLTRVEPQVSYAVRAATLHPIEEQARSEVFLRELPSARSEAELSALGELLYQAHASYSACGLGSPATDSLVAAVRELGPAQGLFGAKITGGGSGGTVAILALTERLPQVRDLAAAQGRGSGRLVQVFSESSAGAGAVPALRSMLAPPTTS